MAFSYVMHRTLGPTARMSRWYIEVLRQLDPLVFPQDLGPYDARRRLDEQAVLGVLYFAANYWLKISP
jgi:hypothetical protein